MNTFEIQQITHGIIEGIKNSLSNVKSDKWMGMQEACRYSSCSHSTLRRAIKSSTLKTSKTTGRYLFKKSDIDRWLGRY
jgi:excisionase family DNA binding protein